MAIKFSIPVEIEADNISSFSDITEQIDKLELNKRAFEKAVYLLDDKKATEIAGEKYSREHHGMYRGSPGDPCNIGRYRVMKSVTTWIIRKNSL